MATLAPVRTLGSAIVKEATTSELLARAGARDAEAWAGIVQRYERLVWSIARSFRYDDATTADVVQTVWLRLAEHCGRIRDPERLASWLGTTCRNECLSIARRHREVCDETVLDRIDNQGRGRHGEVDERHMEDEMQNEALRAFSRLPAACQELLRLLCADPPLDYQSIAALTGRAVGSIGPTRQRCLGKLRELMVTADV